MSACETEQLYEMLAMKQDYLPEAIEAARAELNSRHLSPEMDAEIQHAIAAEVAAQKQLQDLALRPFHKVLLVICSGGLLSPFMIAYFFAKGQTRRFSESWRWWGLGLSFWVSWALFWGLLGSALVGIVLSIGVTCALYYYMLLRPRAEEQQSSQAPSLICSRAMFGAGYDCVSCRTPLPAGARICPHCGWTQPGQSSFHANVKSP